MGSSWSRYAVAEPSPQIERARALQNGAPSVWGTATKRIGAEGNIVRMTKENGLLEWVDADDGTRQAIVRVGGRTGMMIIKQFEGTQLIECVVNLGSAVGASQMAVLEEIGQSWMERVGGEPA
jgi:hypothetical protein